MYAKGLSVRDIQDTLEELYGVEVLQAQSVRSRTKWSLVEAWQSRPLTSIYVMLYLDAIHINLRRDGKVENTAMYIVLGVDLEGHRDVLGHWAGHGGELANFWLRGRHQSAKSRCERYFHCLYGWPEWVRRSRAGRVPKTQIQRCIIHQIRNSLKYVSWKDYKAFLSDLKEVYQAPTLEAAETHLVKLGDTWRGKYALAVRSWENNWPDLSTFFDYPAEIRRLIYTTNTVEGYNRQLRKVIKTKGGFPNAEAARKLLFLATQDIAKKWTKPMMNWAMILNQLTIRFEDRLSL